MRSPLVVLLAVALLVSLGLAAVFALSRPPSLPPAPPTTVAPRTIRLPEPITPGACTAAQEPGYGGVDPCIAE